MKRWDNLNHAFEYLKRYINGKPRETRFKVSEIDLALVSNFKGGNASVVEPVDRLTLKLVSYGDVLGTLAGTIDGKPLRSFVDTGELAGQATAFLRLTKVRDTAIAGFGASYASALLAAYFPETLPVLDRRVLSGARIDHARNSQGQVLEIEKHYPELIARFHAEMLRRPNLRLRDLDREWFSIGNNESQLKSE
ncbi:hypothetical protein [Bradyrhizobium sp. RD5-C2]|uniref:hypothetical protein n=1 Tax=Bradyrhizobium sp. RD5-C2 TaxID=244562 RepID=UPI001CC38610|nr:hypothetical protein [Bradyrhizobium sp. RD5-C2]GIQ76217.1 hypothetical protein BraRD5C2_46610 [Bradyrhizobium sp. RD5-C2]